MTNATKAAKKAPAKKALARKAAATKKTTAPERVADTATTEAPTVTFQDREITVRPPNDTQIMMWNRLGRRWAKAKASDLSADDVSTMSDQIMTIIDSVLVDDEDKDWLSQEMIAGRVEIDEAADIVALAAKLRGGKVAAPRTGPTSKARRR